MRCVNPRPTPTFGGSAAPGAPVVDATVVERSAALPDVVPGPGGGPGRGDRVGLWLVGVLVVVLVAAGGGAVVLLARGDVVGRGSAAPVASPIPAPPKPSQTSPPPRDKPRDNPYTLYESTGGTGFYTVTYPTSWRRSVTKPAADRGTVALSAPDGHLTFTIDHSTPGSEDTLAALQARERATVGSFSDYRRIRLASKYDFGRLRGAIYNPTIWEFLYTRNGVRTHVVIWSVNYWDRGHTYTSTWRGTQARWSADAAVRSGIDSSWNSRPL
jgi:hypothetical protein